MQMENWNTMTVFSTRILIWVSAVLILFIGTANAADALEQNVGSEHKMTEQAAMQLDTVVVTAQKREEKIQDVPISMDVLTGMELEEAGIHDVKTMTAFSPNVYSKQNVNQNMVIIRGISSHNVVLNTPAGLFVDDINYPMTFMQNPDLVDVERIEILRGPQGTLYGRNTESGVIKIVTRQPDNEFRGKIFTEVGVYDTPNGHPWLYRTGAGMNAPLVNERLFLNVAAQIKKSDGYTVNEYNGDDKAGKIDHQSGQAALRWTPNEKWDMTFLVNGQQTDDGYGHLRYIDGPAATDRYKINWDGSNEWKDKNNGQALKIKYAAEAFDLLAITTRSDFQTDFINDGEFGPMVFPDQVFHFANTTISQEIRMASREDQGPLKWLFGLYYFKDDNNAVAEFFGQSRKTDFDTQGYAVFGQATYTLFDRLHITGGLRFDHQDADGRQQNNMTSAPYSAKAKHNEFLPKATISYDFTENVMVYGSVARGLLAGGYNYAFAMDSDSLTFKPETTWNYELGFKAELFDKKLLLNAAAFYIDIEDKQVEEFISGPTVRSVANAAKAFSRGFELDATFRPWLGVSLFGGIGFSEARIKTWEGHEMDGSRYDYHGKRLPHAPDFTYHAGFSYKHIPSGLWFRTDLLGVGNCYSDTKNSSRISGHEIVNMTLGYQGEFIDVSLWAKNLFDREYVTSKSYYIGGNIVEDAPPRTIGTTITYRF